MVFSKERLFINSELEVGRRVCAALKKKRVFFQSLYDRQEQFRFHGTTMDCNGTITLNSDFDATISTSAMEYSSLTPRDNYFRDIVTDRSGVINDLCVSISASDNVSNTIYSGSVKYTVNFLIAENYDRYDVKKNLVIIRVDLRLEEGRVFLFSNQGKSIQNSLELKKSALDSLVVVGKSFNQ